MIRTSGVIAVLAAAMFFSVAPARGDEYYGPGQQPQDMPQGQKNECLLVAMNCPDSYKADTVDQRIDRLKKEIAKGTDVYSDQELQSLKHQLNQLEEPKGAGDSYQEQ